MGVETTGGGTLVATGTYSRGMPRHNADEDKMQKEPYVTIKEEVVAAINAGEDDNPYTSIENITFSTDNSYTGGDQYDEIVPIAGTEDDALYQTERYGEPPLSYAINVENGGYYVKLHFAELYFDAPNERIFDVVIEGKTVIENLDIYDEVGKYRAYDVAVLTDVKDGTLNISFTNKKNFGKVGAITVYKKGFGIFEVPAIKSEAGESQTASVGSRVDLNGSESRSKVGEISYSWTQISGPCATLYCSQTATPYFIPSTAGTYVFKLTVVSGEEIDEDEVTIQVGSNNLFAIPGRIEAEDYKEGGQGVGYYDKTAGNYGGCYRSDDVDIGVASDHSGNYAVGWIKNGEWLAYDVNVSQTGTYTFTARVSAYEVLGKSFHLEVDGVNVSGQMSFLGTGGWQNWTDMVWNGIQLTEGVHEIRLVMESDSFKINYFDLQLLY